MLCLHHCNSVQRSQAKNKKFHSTCQASLDSLANITGPWKCMYIFSVYSMMSELYLCVQGFFFFMSMGVLTLTHPRLLPTLTFTFTCCWGFTSRTSPPKICTQEASTLRQAAPHHCVLWVSHVDRHMWTLTHPPMLSLSPVSEKKKKAYVQYALRVKRICWWHMYTQTQFPTDTLVKSHQKGVFIALFGSKARLNF